MKQVSRSVHIDPDYGGCTVGAIQSSRGVVLIDSPKQPTRAARWLSYVSDLGKVRYLVNTEHHIDHTFGNGFLPGIVVASQGVKDRFWVDSPIGVNPMKSPHEYVQRTDPLGVNLLEGYVPREPELTFSQGARLSLTMDGLTIEVLPAPGHTEAECAVYVREEGVLFASDNVFNGCMTWYHDCLPYHWLETLNAFARMEVEVLVPGHGEPGGAELIHEMRRKVEEAVDRVESAVDAGRSREEAIEQVSFSDWDLVAEDHLAFADRLKKIFVARIYDEISAVRTKAPDPSSSSLTG